MEPRYRLRIGTLAIANCLVLFATLCCPAVEGSGRKVLPFPAHVQSQPRRYPEPARPTIGVVYPYICPHDVTLTKLLMNQTTGNYVQYTEYATKLPTLHGFTMHYWFNLANATTTSTMFNYGLDERTQNNDLTVQLEVNELGEQFFTIYVDDTRISHAPVYPAISTDSWHHALHSWSSALNRVSHFLDGKLVKTHHVSLKHRPVVPGGGVAVSGQHQKTSLNSGMDQGEGLTGWLTLFQLSSKPLDMDSGATESSVARLASQCTGEWEGDLISWSKTPRRGYGGVMEAPSHSKVCGVF